MSKRVLNKYREVHQSKATSDDILIEENTPHLVSSLFTGHICKFGLNKDWREKLISQDLEGVKSGIEIDNCRLLARNKLFYDKILNEKEKLLNDSDCSYNQTVDIKCTEPGLFWGCWKYTDITRRITDGDCVVRRDQKNKIIVEYNAHLRVKQEKALEENSIIEKELIKCQLLANFDIRQD